MKKKILLLSDDIRSYTGVGIMSKHLILGSVHKYDWAQLAAKSKTTEVGSAIDVSDSVNKLTGQADSHVRLYPNTGYGDESTLMGVIQQESPDLILTFTDPRYWTWFHKLEREIRQTTPIGYYHVWDNYPCPHFNRPVYDSCDWIGCISKLTYDIVTKVCPYRKDWMTSYVPHGVCSKTYYPIDDNEELMKYKSLLVPGGDKLDYIVLCNNANLRRKQLPNLLVSFKDFCDQLPTEQRSGVALVLHTNPHQPNGCNVYDIVNSFGDNYNIYVSDKSLSDVWLNRLYNISDVTINVASAEGFGLSTLESMMTGTPIIANQTGGMVDQSGTDTSHEWVYKLNPTLRNIVGSPSVSYLYEDYCSRSSIVDSLRYWHEMSPTERHTRGKSGHQFATENFSLSSMIEPFIEGLDNTLENFTPRPRFDCMLVTNRNTARTYTDREDTI